jgi:hypothetical protein
MNTAQFTLNKELLEAAKRCDLIRVEELLRQGADPLGSADANDQDEDILGELFYSSADDEKVADMMPELLRLFFAHGMDITARNILDDDENNINPLWNLAFVSTESGLKILHVLLEHGLDRLSAEILVEHIFIDMELCDGCDIEDGWWRERWSYSLKMVMLAASYPHILENSKYIADCISLAKNDAARLISFRNWNQFTYQIDLSTCDNIPHGLRSATVRIKDKETGKIVWTMVI